MISYLDFPTPIWLQALILVSIVWVSLRLGVHAALSFYVASFFSNLIVHVGPFTLVPLAFAGFVASLILSLRRSDGFSFPWHGLGIVSVYLILLSFTFVRGAIELYGLKEYSDLTFLLLYVNAIPIVIAGTLSWQDREDVARFGQGFVWMAALQLVLVAVRLAAAGVGIGKIFGDLWLSDLAGDENTQYTSLVGITNYHWYSWVLGTAAIVVVFQMGARTRESVFLRIAAIVAQVIFCLICIQQIVVVGSRQSAVSLVLAVMIGAWLRGRRFIARGAAAILVVGVLFQLMSAYSYLLPFAFTRGEATFGQSVDPIRGRAYVWEEGLATFVRAPILGDGFRSSDGMSLGHNLFVNTLANLGLVGFALLMVLISMYLSGPVRKILRKRYAERDIDIVLLGIQIFWLGTSLASGSVVSSAGLFLLGAIVLRRSSRIAPVEERRMVTVRPLVG